ncbi:MAG TPA: NAD(P)-binding protein [Methanobacterium sp.]
MENVKILGAGPAGLSAAINLSRNGYNVDVFEKNQDVGLVLKETFKVLKTGQMNRTSSKNSKK